MKVIYKQTNFSDNSAEIQRLQEQEAKMRADLKANHEKGERHIEELQASCKKQIELTHKDMQSQHVSGMAKIKQLQDKIKALKAK